MFPVNSEIRRYYWLDFSIQRVIAMPVVLLAVLYIMSVSDSSSSSIATLYSTLFVIIVYIWGGYQAANSIVEDVKNNCWDNQCLSSVSPWQLSLGKLFGSTLYSWYGGIIAIVIYIIYSLMDQSPFVVAFNALLFIIGALLCHTLSLLTSIQSLRIHNRYGNFHSIIYLIVGLIVAENVYTTSHRVVEHVISNNDFSPVTWFNTEMNGGTFTIISLFIFLGWAIIGLIRLMREELKFKNIPWVWALFVLFTIVYMAGLSNGPHTHYSTPEYSHKPGYRSPFYTAENTTILESSRLGIALLIASISVYWMFFGDIITITRYRMLRYQWQANNWRKIGETIPRWAISFVITIIAAILFTLSMEADKMGGAAIFVISTILFMLRDAAIVHYFKFSTQNKRATLATLFYYAILYMLIPGIFMALKLDNLNFVFYPVIKNDMSIVMLLPIILELLIAGCLLCDRWVKRNQEI